MIMIALEFTCTGLALFTKGAFNGGMSPHVFVVYRQAIATLIMLPLAFFSNRPPSPVTGPLFRNIYEDVGWCRVTANQNAYFQGINLASSTAATAIINLIPAFTFVFAAILGMEKVNIRSSRSGAKIFGTVICVVGAMAMALTKGPKLLNSFIDHNNWLMGCLLLFASSILWSMWTILQVPIAATCPDLMYSSAWLCSLATIQSTMVTLFLERKKGFSAWKLNSFFELGCCLYSGVSLALTFLGQAWCVGERGPVFPAIFNPLCTVITAIFATIFLHEQTYIGGLIGAVIVIMGLYLVLWGKAEDMEEKVKEKGLVIDLEEPFVCNKPILV
ncbi:WAT1-related protein At4g28040 [Linum grandiflorum]